MTEKYSKQHETFKNNFIGRCRAKRFFESLPHERKVMLPITKYEKDSKGNVVKTKVIEVATDELISRPAFDWCYEQLGLDTDEKKFEYLESIVLYLHRKKPDTARDLLHTVKPFGEELKRIRLESFCIPAVPNGVEALKIRV